MEYLLTFQNTHYAIHSEKILIQKKISVSVMALPSCLGDFCGICLRVAASEFVAGRKYLSEANIPVEGIFKIDGANNNERTYTRWKP